MLRIASIAALIVLVAGGCGSSSRPATSAGRSVPRTLAHRWAARASAVAAAAAAGEGCRARRLAGSLRTEVIAGAGRIPARLRTPLLEDVNSLADRIVCAAPPVRATTAPSTQSSQKPKEHSGHEHGGHHWHHGHGDQRRKS